MGKYFCLTPEEKAKLKERQRAADLRLRQVVEQRAARQQGTEQEHGRTSRQVKVSVEESRPAARAVAYRIVEE